MIFYNPLQLFDEDNPLHKSESKYIFTTEGHVVPIDQRFREKSWEDQFPCEEPNNEPPANISNVRNWFNTQYRSFYLWIWLVVGILINETSLTVLY